MRRPALRCIALRCAALLVPRRRHEDGGVYSGQWRGLKKEGLGVYRYASGARYEGEWRDNVKVGRAAWQSMRAVLSASSSRQHACMHACTAGFI